MIQSDIWEKYLSENASIEDELLQEITRVTHLKTVYPQMLSGHTQGIFLQIISKLVKPKIVLEIGTFTGYSAICLAKGLENNGILHTCEHDDQIVPIAENFFVKAGLQNKIKIHEGNALETINKLDISIDLAFLDGDKSQYTEYYNLIFPKLKIGGILLADNVLWYGKVLDTQTNKDPNTLGIAKFNETLANDKRMLQLIIPLRDGLMMAMKINY